MSYLRKAFNLITSSNKVGIRNEAARKSWVESKLTRLPAGLRILDAGAGEQQYKKYCTHLQNVSQDFGQYDGIGDNVGLQMGKWYNSNLDIVGDIVDIFEPDDSFDVILCKEVFEQLPNPVLAIQEFFRLLKSGGQLLITAPFCSLTHFEPYHYATCFNRYFYEKHLADNGFQSVVIESNGNFFEFVAQEVRRIEDAATLYSNKRRPHIVEQTAIWVILNLLNKMPRNYIGSGVLQQFNCHVQSIRV